MDLQKAKNKLKECKQEHIIKKLEEMEGETQRELVQQILEYDLEQIETTLQNKQIKNKNDKIEPIDYVDKAKLSQQEREIFSKLGEKVIKENQYAVVTMAGGQGTRLGCNGPKGSYKLNIGENGKYIFEILVDTLKRAKEKYGIEVYWYIMTSVENNKQTIEFLEENNYFGYNKEKVRFFIQGVYPIIDLHGKVVIDETGKIKTASNGNGSVYMSLEKSGMLSDMRNKNIKWVYICGVDNIMVNMVDSLFLGLAIEKGVQSASKSVKKSYPEEKVGIYCKKNGRPSVIEYIDMTQEMIHQKNIDGELLYGESNIVSHLFRVEALEEISKHNLKYHCALKKNNYKFESFIFDGFEFLNDMAIMRVKREEEFAPVKNAEGVDSPATAIEIYENYWKGE